MITIKLAMRGLALASVLALGAGLSACGSTGAAATNGSHSSGSYAVVRYAGLSSVEGSQPGRWSQLEIDQLLELDASCSDQLDPQFPNKVLAIVEGTVENSLLTALGVGGGSNSLTGANPAEYGAYGAAAGAVSGGVSENTAQNSARKYAQAYCVQLQIGWAQQEGALRRIGVVPFTARGRTRLPGPTD